MAWDSILTGFPGARLNLPTRPEKFGSVIDDSAELIRLVIFGFSSLTSASEIGFYYTERKREGIHVKSDNPISQLKQKMCNNNFMVSKNQKKTKTRYGQFNSLTFLVFAIFC